MNRPEILGDYQIIKQIGRGALGAVYLAEHRFMKKQFVLKVLPEELASDRQFVQRFEEEAARVAALEHPHIVKVHNVSHADGRYFLVADCVVDELGETTNLAQYMLSRGSRLEERELLRLLEQVAGALDYAHGKKNGGVPIVHGGVKLNNILVGKGADGMELYLCDFCLSRIIGEGAMLSRTYKAVAEVLDVAPSVIFGEEELYPAPPVKEEKLAPLHASFQQTFAFLAPEQKRGGANRQLSIKTDNYAFGILAYTMITGQFPEGCFPMPSEAVPEYRWNWDFLIRSCLQLDPAKRIDLLLPALKNVSEIQKATTGEQGHPAAEKFAVKQEEKRPEPVAVQAPPVKKVAPAVEEQAPAAEEAGLRPVLQHAELERPVTDPDPGAIFRRETTVTHYVPEEKEKKNVQPLLTDMVVIKGGTFWRGSNEDGRDEMPRHQITIDSFALDIHPVANEQFVRFLEALGGEKDSNHQDVIRLRDSRIKRSGGKLSIESGYAKHPVVGVTWYGAVAYAKWIGKRLPTEAEWEAAAKGGNEAALYPTGEDIEKSQANFFSSDTTAVMSYAPNCCGLYDMPGNVYEWCNDWYGYNYYETSMQEPDRPKGPIQGVYRVLRGGCWKSLKEDLRCSKRHRNNPGTVNGTYGFRCAADVKQD